MSEQLVAGRYRLGRSLGSGGMGRVWHARDEVLRRSVAVKEVLLPESLAEDEATELRMRTLREARAAARLSHPNVVRIYDVIYADGRPWIVMEYVPSKSLAHVISENGPISPAAAAKVGIAVLDALCAAHDAGVLHRDVKPGNVLLGANGRVVLTDFGLAVYDDLGMALTKSGVIHGSPQFIAPERALDGTSTQESDMWSLGATLYAAVEGRSPYSRPSSYATLTALATSPPDPPHRAGGLKPVLAGLLRRNPKSRMKPTEIRARLQRVVAADAGKARPKGARKPGEAEAAQARGPQVDPAAPSAGAAPPVDAQVTGVRPDAPPGVLLPIMPDWQQPAADGALGTPSGERRVVTPLPRRNPGEFTGTAPRTPSPPTPAAAPGPARPLDDSGVGLIDLVAGLERDDITPMLPYPPPGIRRRAWRSRGTRQWLLVLLIAVVVGGTVVVAAAMGGRHPQHPAAVGQSSVSPGIHAQSPVPPKPVVLTFPCPGTAPGTLHAVPQGPQEIDNRGVLTNFTWYVSPGGAKIGVPVSWGEVTAGNMTCFYDSTGQHVLGVMTMAIGAVTPARELQAIRDQMFAAAGGPPTGYGMVSFGTDQYSPKLGHWEYRYTDDHGQVKHVQVRINLPAKGRALAYSFEDNDFNWATDGVLLDEFFATFGLMKA